MLKKTYPHESIDQRLARMESQLFGMPAQSMPYIDRIDRLKKTIGMDVIGQPGAQVATRQPGKGPISLNGPLPRANRGGGAFQVNPFHGGPTLGGGPNTSNKSGYIYDSDGNITGWYQNNSQSWSSNGNSNAFPEQSGGQNVFEAMDQMNRQMNEMMRNLRSPGIGGFGGGMGGFGGPGGYENGFSIQIGPDGIKTNTFPQGAPSINRSNPGRAQTKEQQAAPAPKKFTAPNKDLPAYTDPNSI